MSETIYPYQVAKAQQALEVRNIAFRTGINAFKNLQEKKNPKRAHKEPEYRKSAEELLLAHPEYLDDEQYYFNWFAYWYAAGYESKEEEFLSQQAEYFEWR